MLCHEGESEKTSSISKHRKHRKSNLNSIIYPMRSLPYPFILTNKIRIQKMNKKQMMFPAFFSFVNSTQYIFSTLVSAVEIKIENIYKMPIIKFRPVFKKDRKLLFYDFQLKLL